MDVVPTSLKATHLAGTLNNTAAEESHVMKDISDWMLCPRVFSKINQKTGPLQVDFFASLLSSMKDPSTKVLHNLECGIGNNIPRRLG